MSIEVTVKHHFSAGHRIEGLVGPGGKCANLHGHTFGLEWTFRTDSIQVGAIEFASVKAILREWVRSHLDHGFLVYREDRAARDALAVLGSKHHVMASWPTTEAIAAEVADATRELLGPAGALLTSVVVTEGPHNSARWTA